ncbi:unnamed protein product [Calypogeia fissa]
MHTTVIGVNSNYAGEALRRMDGDRMDVRGMRGCCDSLYVKLHTRNQSCPREEKSARLETRQDSGVVKDSSLLFDVFVEFVLVVIVVAPPLPWHRARRGTAQCGTAAPAKGPDRVTDRPLSEFDDQIVPPLPPFYCSSTSSPSGNKPSNSHNNAEQDQNCGHHYDQLLVPAVRKQQHRTSTGGLVPTTPPSGGTAAAAVAVVPPTPQYKTKGIERYLPYFALPCCVYTPALLFRVLSFLLWWCPLSIGLVLASRAF